MRYRLLLFGMLLFAVAAHATHNRAGEITFEYVGPYPALTYRITITTYTRTSSVQADRPQLDSVYFGDNSPSVTFNRLSKFNLGNDISKNIYIAYHTYPGNGSYVIHFEDPNRNEGVVNIPSSVDVPFYVESLLIIDPYRFPNNSPVLTYPPIDRGCVGRTFIHNPNAYDPDGDSLSYELITCSGAGGLPIPGYLFPVASLSFTLDPVTGDLVWDTPVSPGEYNVAFRIVSWRRGVNLGYVVRDMQILIGDCNNRPPYFLPLNDTCVVAGDTIDFNVTAIDPDGNRVQLSATGGPFEVRDSATFTPVQYNNDTAISRFNWVTACDLVRSQPYYAQFKAQDVVPLDSISLVSLSGVFIHIYGPPPAALTAVAAGTAIHLDWLPSGCPTVTGYRIYRRNGIYPGVIPCPCDNGAPSYSGYQLIGTVTGASVLQFDDTNNGNGLVIGIEYCYIVTAVYPDGSESCASPQACASIRKDLPVITNADVRETDAVNGSIYVAWSKPNELDTLQYPGPYQYRLYRSSDFNFTNPVIISSLVGLDDTTFIDTLINTVGGSFSYKVELYYTFNGAFVRKGSSAAASSIYLSLSPTDERMILSWRDDVPWTNSRYDVYRLNPVTQQFDSIGFATGTTYVDSFLVNGNTYCYYVKGYGSYSYPGFVFPILNRSQRTCGIPVDNVPPCPPVLNVLTSCIDRINQLVWAAPVASCAADIAKYYIYFAPSAVAGYERIDSVLNPLDTVYSHGPLSELTGCYKVSAVDSIGNESLNPIAVCVDSCRQYVLPSVFTPNGDGVNDLFHPCDQTTDAQLQQLNCPPYRNVKDIDLNVYNRWGTLVFHTTDRDINWDGKEEKSGNPCPDGTYYYTCRVNFYRLQGVESVDLHGTVEIIGSSK
jgi:gliding motility-associated-like protein